MTTTSGGEDTTTVSPDVAFAVLGNETRMEILQTLSDANEPLVFSELYDRVEYDTTANFNYHLDMLEGHFVQKTGGGYALRQAGRRVIQAVLSGAVTDDPVMERTEVEKWSCPYCGAPTEVEFRQERVERYCTECAGLYEESATRGSDISGGDGDLGYLYLPPAGVQGRTATEVLEAAATWSYAEFLVAANGVCPRCSGPVEQSVKPCEDHSDTGTICNQCGRRHAVSFHTDCLNCNFELQSVVSMHLAASTELLAFMTARGVNPLSNPWNWGWEYEEEILSTNPFEGRFTFTIDGDELTLTVDDDLSVVEATEHETSRTAR